MKRLPIQKLYQKEEISALLFLASTLLLALKVSPKVGTSGQAPLVAQAAAPWIFGPVQFLLYYFSPWIAAVLFPLMLILPLTFLPWINRLWGERAARIVILVICGIILLLLAGFMIREQGIG